MSSPTRGGMGMRCVELRGGVKGCSQVVKSSGGVRGGVKCRRLGWEGGVNEAIKRRGEGLGTQRFPWIINHPYDTHTSSHANQHM